MSVGLLIATALALGYAATAIASGRLVNGCLPLYFFLGAFEFLTFPAGIAAGFGHGGEAVNAVCGIYATALGSLAIGYCAVGRRVGLNFGLTPMPSMPYASVVALWASLLMALMLQSSVGQPLFTRELYAQSRVGHGHMTYAIEASCLLAAISAIFFPGRTLRWALLATTIVLSASLGRKMLVAQVLFIIALGHTIILHGQIHKRVAVPAAIAGGCLLIAMWAVHERYWAAGNYAASLLTYGDPGRNLQALILNQDVAPPLNYSMENNLYSLIPRAVWNEKPIYYGNTALSEAFLPESTQTNRGAPSFGRFGANWADFQYLVFPILAMFYTLLGMTIRALEEAATKTRSPVIFGIYLSAAGCPLVATGNYGFSNVIASMALCALLLPHRTAKLRHCFPQKGAI